MHAWIESGSGHWESFLCAFVLVMIRLSGLMVFAPVFSSQAIPARVKAVLVLAISILLAPVVAGLPNAHTTLGILPVAGEMLTGMLFGFALSLLNELLVFTGQVLGMQFSFSLVNLMDPNSQVQTPILGQLFGLLGTMVLLAAGLDRVMLAAVIRSFAEAPVGATLIGGRVAVTLVGMTGGVFVAALQLSAPVIAATLLVELAVALLSKLSPQIPVLAITVPAKTTLGYVALIAALALWPRFIEARFNGLLDQAVSLLHQGAARL